MTQPSPPQPTIPSVQSQQEARAGQYSTTSAADDWTSVYVFTGRKESLPRRVIEAPGMPGVKLTAPAERRDVRVTAGQLANEWFTMDGVERKRYQDTFILLGLVNPRQSTDMDYSQAWIAYVKQLASYNAANPNSMLTIGDLLDADIRRKEENDPNFAEQLRTGKRTSTRTSTNLQMSSNLDARALADAAAAALLGRRATEEESAKALSAINALEKANPETTTVTQEEDIYTGDILSQQSTTTGGVTAEARQQIAKEQAMANPEYGAYQASTTYMGALMDMVYGKGY